MNISIEQLKIIINQFENTIFPDDVTKIQIPILVEDFTWLKYDNETVKTQNIHFTKIKDTWYIDI